MRFFADARTTWNWLPSNQSVALAAAGSLILAVHRDGVVGGRLRVPDCARGSPATVLHWRIAEVRQQVEALRKQPDGQPVGVSVPLARIIIQPRRPRVASFA